MPLVLAVMPPIFGVILTTGQYVAALTGIGLFVGVLWKGGRWVYNYMTRIEALIGTNGGSSLFQSIDSLKDEIKVLGSKLDLMPAAMLWFSPGGKVESVNVAFTKRTGWELDDLAHGGWRLKLSEDARDEWDDIVSTTANFSLGITLQTDDGKPLQTHIAARAVFNAGRFLGWRAVLE